MRNRIACSAQTLTQLQPEMIRSVVGGQVFRLGNQYFSESRVQILEHSAAMVSAEVSGTFGVYTQTIKLRSGVLSTKCSCPSNEKPFCRHCVAVLLQHYEDMADENENDVDVEADSESVNPPPRHDSTVVHSSSNDFNFRDVTIFVDWLSTSVQVLGQSGPLPPLPSLPAGPVREWSEAIVSLHQRIVKSVAMQQETHTELKTAQEQIVRLTQDLESARSEVKATQAISKELESEIKKYQDSLAVFAQVGQERDVLAKQLQDIRGEVRRRGTELAGLSKSLDALSNGLPEQHHSR
ncbi:MAG: SWIM zinc finger family protein [Nitrospirales bacterium]|nr:SWIM zinc finger family protein [Nitrospira sp.]MDR4501567.1 SWIM zinc finger family protein [Nitrospirales bacterium]